MVTKVTKPVGDSVRAVDGAKSSAFNGDFKTFCGRSADEFVFE